MDYLRILAELEAIKSELSNINYLVSIRLNNIFEAVKDYYINKCNNEEYQINLNDLTSDEVMQEFITYNFAIRNLTEDEKSKEVNASIEKICEPYITELKKEINIRKKEEYKK